VNTCLIQNTMQSAQTVNLEAMASPQPVLCPNDPPLIEDSILWEIMSQSNGDTTIVPNTRIQNWINGVMIANVNDVEMRLHEGTETIQHGSMTVEEPKMSKSTAYGITYVLLRWGSVLLCVAGLSTACSTPPDVFAIVPPAVILVWDLVYLILVRCQVKVHPAVVITLELLSWSAGAALASLDLYLQFLTSYVSFAPYPLDIVSDSLTCILVIVHFTLFIYAIVIFRRA